MTDMTTAEAIEVAREQAEHMLVTASSYRDLYPMMADREARRATALRVLIAAARAPSPTPDAGEQPAERAQERN